MYSELPKLPYVPEVHPESNLHTLRDKGPAAPFRAGPTALQKNSEIIVGGRIPPASVNHEIESSYWLYRFFQFPSHGHFLCSRDLITPSTRAHSVPQFVIAFVYIVPSPPMLP